MTRTAGSVSLHDPRDVISHPRLKDLLSVPCAPVGRPVRDAELPAGTQSAMQIAFRQATPEDFGYCAKLYFAAHLCRM